MGIAATPEALSSDPADYDSDGDGRPDQPSEETAIEVATRLGVEVEVLSLRSESQTVVADAEGLLSVEDFGSPIRIQTDPDGADDGWVDVDYDLEETGDGVWAPKASRADVVVNGTVDGVVEAARVTYEDGSSVAVTWPEDNPGELGEPVIEGGLATYPLEGFSGSVDLVVAMTTTGASTWLRINEALTPEETAAIESEGVTFGVRTSGGVDLQTSDEAIAADPALATDVSPGALVLTDDDGEAVGATPPLVAWDSSALDEVGMPTEYTLLGSDLTELEGTGDPGDAGDASGSGDSSEHELTVTPPAELLGGTDGAGAGVEYPVIIDPQFENLTQSQDTWIRNGTTALNGSDSKLLVGKHGTSGAAANLAASLLQFQSTVFDGRQIDQAYLGLYQYGAGTCADRTMNIYSIRDQWAQSQTTWANQPSFYNTNFETATQNRAPSCSSGAGYVDMKITPIVRDWAHGARPNRGVILAAPNGSDTTSARSYCSMDYSAAFPGCDHKPYLRVSYSLAIAGQRPGASHLSFTASDRINTTVDVGTGNLMVTVNGLNLPTMDGQLPLSATYNAVGGSTDRRLGRGWILENTTDIRMTPRAGSQSSADVVFTGPGGRTEEFTTTTTSGSGVTSYDSPDGVKADLFRSSNGYTLKMRESQMKYVFSPDGGLLRMEDRNGNTTGVSEGATPSGSAYKNLTIETPAGSVAARTGNITTTSNGTTTITQGTSSALRTISFARSNNQTTSFTDARGRTTTFSYNSNGLLSEIAAPGNVTTQFTYDDRRRVTAVTQVENASGGPGNSITRFSYPNRHLTRVAAPDTNQSQSVDEAPNTVYEIDDYNRVKKTIDPEGRERSRTYTPNSDTATSTLGASSGGGGGGGAAAGSTITNTWEGNGGDSMTGSTMPTGASSSWEYNGTAGAVYSPTSSEDDAGNQSLYTYNGAGNQMTSSDASQATAEVTRNSDGTIDTATSPGNGSNDTNYGYTNRQVTSMTPVTGSSLTARAYTYDTVGRLATSTNGRGITTTYSYNENDQVVSVTHDGGGTGGSGTQTVTYGYDAAGRQNSRVDTHGTTTTTYDQLGRLLTRVNTAGGGTITYTYDKASRLASSTSTEGGTTNYAYDNAGTPTGYNYPVTPGSSTRITVRFTTDDKGRRTGTYVAPNADFTTWTARTTNTYDKSGRVSRVRADRGNGTPDIIDVSYCYVAGTTPASACPENDTDNDRAKLAWKKDNLTGDGVRYTYDETGRLTNAQPTAGGTTYSYDYNQAGARTSATAGSTTQTLTFNAAHQISTSGYTYDGAGNLTADPASGSTNITYTPADQLNSVNKNGTTYYYSHAGDDNNELLEQSSPDGTYRYTYGRNAGTGVPVVEQVHRTFNSNGSVVTNAAAVISDPVTGTPVMLKSDDGIASIYVYDGTPGAPIALISDQAGQAARTAAYTYDPYGAATTAAGANPNVAAENPYTFSGNGVRDRTTNWVHYGERYYSTRTGTFTQQDTLDAPLDPNNANRYAYAGGDPINNTDPTGRYSWDEFKGDAKGAISSFADGWVDYTVTVIATTTFFAFAGTSAGCIAGAWAGPPGCAAGAQTGAGIGTAAGFIYGNALAIGQLWANS
ncbi:DNRLRE domain-containing protein [Nocardioides zeae]|uniref:DNRLRE domain-containing protein n=1 Tax=Nocardioides zeae TaxID=1457234 RepID=UPI0027D7E5FF|nr:DNRLRE domain-containing protein [Nocardioides zeae]